MRVVGNAAHAGRHGALTAAAILFALAVTVPAAHARDGLAEGPVEVVRGTAKLLGSGPSESLRLRPGGAARTLFREIAAERVVVRMRRSRCATPLRLVVRVDGRRVIASTSRRSGLRVLSGAVRLAGGDHRVDVVALRRGRGRCTPEARVEQIELRSDRRRVPLGAAVNWAAINDDAYRDTFLREFDSLTPENEMKMPALFPSPDGLSFGAADDILDFAGKTGKEVRGHALIWGLAVPPWLSTRSVTGPALTGTLRSFVSTVVSRYRGRIREWDVVNEPLADDGTLAGNLWTAGMGAGYIDVALRTAREADPAAKLFINEIGTELGDRKFDGLLRLARDLKSRGVPLDGLGLQNHTNVNRFPSRGELAERMRRIAALGLEVQLTEMDVSAQGTTLSAGEVAARQTAAYTAAAQACNEVPACTRMTMWGVGDRFSWLGPYATPLLFDRGWAAKPALGALRGVFAPRR